MRCIELLHYTTRTHRHRRMCFIFTAQVSHYKSKDEHFSMDYIAIQINFYCIINNPRNGRNRHIKKHFRRSGRGRDRERERSIKREMIFLCHGTQQNELFV